MWARILRKYVYGMAAWKSSVNIFAVNPWTGNYGDEMCKTQLYLLNDGRERLG